MAVYLIPDFVNPVAEPLPNPVPEPPSVPAVLSRLRLETRGEHVAVERVLNLMDSSLTLLAFKHRLKQFYGFYEPMETAPQARCAVPHHPKSAGTLAIAAVLPKLQKTALLQQGLDHLGVYTESLLLCRNIPPINTQAQVLGCLYVMESATSTKRQPLRY